MISASNALSHVKTDVDALNVFPVPDGDTGTNMSMTITAAATALSEPEMSGDVGIDAVSATAASALLRGARGNSGVILSLLFRGFSKGCKGKYELNGEELAAAMKMGVEAAYKAVLKPTEGTILTVSRMAADAAVTAADNGADPLDVLEAALEAAQRTLDETPEMLPVLKKAGVVDAGGQGYVCILEGIVSFLRSGVGVEPDESAAFTEDGVADPVPLSEDEITFTYCTEFIIGKDPGSDREPELLRSFLRRIGDSIVMVDDEEIIKVHVHTDHPGKALEEALKYGIIEKTKIENMRLQFRKRQSSAAKNEEKTDRVEPEKDYGIVAVAAGEGLRGIFTDLGCDHVVFGGQTMNPSTDDILAACLATPAKTVFVLPNNKNIIMAAEQAIPLAEDRKIVVIPTKTIPQGVAASLAFDPSMSEDELTQTMTDATATVRTGQVTFAARDSDFDGQEIKEGQILALRDGKLSFVGTDENETALQLTLDMAKDGASFVTVFYGVDISENQQQALVDKIIEALPDAEVSAVNGGQPIYRYIISVE